ncbi:restriction endonuclease subunit S, partial [Persephonella sp.]
MVENKTNYKQTEIGLIPEDWEVVRLGEVAEIATGQSAPQGEEYFKNGKYPFIRVSHLSNEGYKIISYDLINDKAVKDYNLKIFPKDSIVFPKSGASIFLEKRAKLSFDAYTVSHLCVVNSSSNDLNQNFLFYTLINKKFAKDKDSNYPTLNINEIKSIQIPLPPLPEQKAIAEVLDKVRNVIEQTEEVIKATKELKKSLMKHLFTYGAVPVDEIDKVKLKETEIGFIPEHWEIARIKDVFEFTVKPRKLKISENDLLPFIPMDFISEEKKQIKGFMWKKAKEITSGSFVFKNDLIIAKITPSFENGKQAILDTLPTNFGYATTEVYALHPFDENQVINEILYFYLKIPKVRKSLSSKMDGTTGRQRVPKHILENLLIPLPPISEQKQIA